ncbi:hypothetical protein Ciccas_000921 [Cichlidogyrus casuarinus]|uniref:Biotin-protein ligase N-terminal domain-containing protein n=1 Tax=Cichlidogyrus casuarinus TaxID=1844966 RepID=A0ABD2QMM9_9PLAT
MPNSTIYIYHDYGTSEFCHSQLKHCAEVMRPDLEVKSLTSDEIIDGKWTKNAALICFGGGFDRGYVHSLGKKGMQIVRDYVFDGGSYLGICAGGYFASKKVIFDDGGPDEVIENRQLRFCQGNAVGPVYPGFRYESEEGSAAVVIHSQMDAVKPMLVTTYFNGGCYFEVDNSKDCQVVYN